MAAAHVPAWRAGPSPPHPPQSKLTGTRLAPAFAAAPVHDVQIRLEALPAHAALAASAHVVAAAARQLLPPGGLLQAVARTVLRAAAACRAAARPVVLLALGAHALWEGGRVKGSGSGSMRQPELLAAQTCHAGGHRCLPPHCKRPAQGHDCRTIGRTVVPRGSPPRAFVPSHVSQVVASPSTHCLQPLTLQGRWLPRATHCTGGWAKAGARSATSRVYSAECSRQARPRKQRARRTAHRRQIKCAELLRGLIHASRAHSRQGGRIPAALCALLAARVADAVCGERGGHIVPASVKALPPCRPAAALTPAAGAPGRTCVFSLGIVSIWAVSLARGAPD